MNDLVMNDEHLSKEPCQMFLFDTGDEELTLSIEGDEPQIFQAILLDSGMAEKLGKALLEWAQSR